MEFVLPIYLMVCVIAAVAVGYERTIGFVPALLLCLALTPIAGVGVCLLFKRLPKACCMKDYRHFSTGKTYYFRKKYVNGQLFYFVQNASAIKVSATDFDSYFSIIVDSPRHLEPKTGRRIRPIS